MGQNDWILPLFTAAALVGPAGWLGGCCYLKPFSPIFEFFCLVPLYASYIFLVKSPTRMHGWVGWGPGLDVMALIWPGLPNMASGWALAGWLAGWLDPPYS